MTAKGTSAGIGADRYVAPAELPGVTVTTAHQLTTHDGATVTGLLRVVPGATTAVFLMHPRQDMSHHVLVPELLGKGYAVWTQSTRAAANDTSLLHEQALLDMAAGHVFVRSQGFENVVSLGHSGGGPLATFYLEQAGLAPGERLKDTPGGKPIPLGEAEMPMADALLLMAPHPGQGQLLTRVIDPAVVDEADPLSIDSVLDMYDPANGFLEPPTSTTYDVEFVERYRAAQLARVARIDDAARERVTAANAARGRHAEQGDARSRRESLASGVIVVHRTDADLRGVDLSIDANDRPYGSLFGRRPDLTNYGIVGFGRVSTPEAWLSTWSGLSSRADLARCAPGVDVPVLLVELTGDQACFPGDANRFAAAFPNPDVTHVRVPGRHFGAALHRGMTSGATLAATQMGTWLGQRFPTAAFVSA